MDLSEYQKEYRRAASRKYYHKNKEAARVRNLQWRLENKDYILEQNRLSKRRRKLEAIEYKGGRCEKCSGVFHPAAFEFHHRDPSQKDRDPSKMTSLSKKRLFAELDKCDLLCANCHRIAHHGGKYD